MDDRELEQLMKLIGPDDRVDSVDVPEPHLSAGMQFATGATLYESPKGGASIPGRSWRAYVNFLRHTGQAPEAVTEEMVTAWRSRR